MRNISRIFATGLCLVATPSTTSAFSVLPSTPLRIATNAFPSSRTAVPSSSSFSITTTTQRNMMLDPSTTIATATTAATTAAADFMNPIVSTSTEISTSLLIAETEAWVQPFASVLGPFLNIFSFAMLCRVVISWYPSTNLNDVPFNIVVWPTEPLLKLIRGSIPPAFGVDITPIVWLGVFTFLNEILLGQQGLLTLKMKYGI